MIAKNANFDTQTPQLFDEFQHRIDETKAGAYHGDPSASRPVANAPQNREPPLNTEDITRFRKERFSIAHRGDKFVLFPFSLYCIAAV